MDELALVKQELATAREQIELLKQTLIVKDVDIQVCKCGVPHKLYIFGSLGDEVPDLPKASR